MICLRLSLRGVSEFISIIDLFDCLWVKILELKCDIKIMLCNRSHESCIVGMKHFVHRVTTYNIYNNVCYLVKYGSKVNNVPTF